MEAQSNKKQTIKHLVFWPPFLVLLGIVVLSFVNNDLFLKVIDGANNWIMVNFGWLFLTGPLFMVFLCIYLLFSRVGNIKIGGPDAKPIFNRFNWFAVTLCTTVAIGIVFWGTAEPIMHLAAPPATLGIEPFSPQAAVYGISTTFMHWGFNQFALYCIPGLMFAFAYYNMKKPYSYSSTLIPLFGDRFKGKLGQIIDAVVVFALVTGVASSLGAGILSIGGGINHIADIGTGPLLWTIIAVAIVATFIISSITGVTKGIRILSDINTKIFFGILGFLIIVGPTAYCLNLGVQGIGDLFNNFFQKTLFTGAAGGDSWPQWWTMFYWAADTAWAPLIAVFIGQISVGYRIKDFMMTCFILPSIFEIIWMTVFGGNAIHMEMVQNLGLASVVSEQGAEAAAYFVFANLPLSAIIIPLFIFIMFVSFVTASDSMTTAMSGLCSTGITPETPEAKKSLKFTWGIIMGAVALVMMIFRGLDGIKMVNTFGGFPAMILEVLIGISFIMFVRNPKKYDTFKEQYDSEGVPLSIDKQVVEQTDN